MTGVQTCALPIWFTVYPEFNMHVHGYEHVSWQPPSDWSHYMAIDPGRQICGVLFMAIPPPRIGDFAVIYDFLHIRHCDAEKFAAGVASKSLGIVYEAMLIDSHAGRFHDIGSGLNVEQQYSNALRRHKVQARAGCVFQWGSDNLDAGILQVHEWLRLRGDGTPKLRVLFGKIKPLEKEFEHYHYDRDKNTGLPTNKPLKKHNNLLDCLRYLIASNPKWHKPAEPKSRTSQAVLAYKEKKKRLAAKAREASGAIRLGSTLNR